MAKILVEYITDKPMDCGCCGGDAYICVPKHITTDGAPFIEVGILGVQTRRFVGNTKYAYTLEYEGSSLIDSTMVLTPFLMKGMICKGCLTDYIDHVSRLSVEDTETLSLHLIDRVLSGDVKVSGAPGNTISVNPDGIFAAGAPFTTVDTPSVDLTYNGTNLSADVIVSQDVGNILEERPDGMYVPEETTLTANDTNSIAIQLSGTANHHIEADLKVSMDAGNAVTVVSDGVYVATPPAPIPNTATDTNTVAFTLSGPLDRDISADVIVSPEADNTLVALPDGLYVPPGSSGGVPNTSTDTNTIDITLSGTLDRHIQADVRVSPDPGNGLFITGNGLYAPMGLETPNSATNTNSIDITLSGVANRDIQADVNVSTDSGNALTILSDGLFVPQETPNSAFDTSTIDITVSGTADRTIQADLNFSSNAHNIAVDDSGLLVGAYDGRSLPLSFTHGGLGVYTVSFSDRKLTPPLQDGALLTATVNVTNDGPAYLNIVQSAPSPTWNSGNMEVRSRNQALIGGELRAGRPVLLQKAGTVWHLVDQGNIYDADGWIYLRRTATGIATHAFTMSGDMRQYFPVGIPVKLNDLNFGPRYGNVYQTTFGSGTTTVFLIPAAGQGLTGLLEDVQVGRIPQPYDFPVAFSWAGLVTYQGFSTPPVTSIQFTVSGRDIWINYNTWTAGVSNSSEFKIILPINSAAVNYMANIATGVDNGGRNIDCFVTWQNASPNVVLNINNSATGWTPSGSKFAYFTLRGRI